MIFLTPILTDTVRAEAIDDVKTLSKSEREEVLDGYEAMYTGDLTEDQTFVHPNAVDELGEEYEEIEFVISTRFKLKGTRYVSDGTFAVDFDTLMDLMRPLIK